MAKHAKLLLNKVINEDDVKAFLRYNITQDDMPTEIDRHTYAFIENYASMNEGQSPSYALVASNVEGFTYIPDVSDSFKYLANQVKAESAKRLFTELFLSGELEDKLFRMDGREFVGEWLPNVLETFKQKTDIREDIGRDIKTGTDVFKSEYMRRKMGESFNVWQSKFSAIGSYTSGNMYTVFGRSGRGKSVMTMVDAIHAAMQGANVLMWSMEMAWFEVFVRIYVIISGELGLTRTQFEGVDMDAGFDSNLIRTGQLSEEFEEAFLTFLKNINEYISGNITVRAVDDEDFTDRSLKMLEHDIEKTNADFVVIDPFYYLHYERNTSKTTGGDAANTSMKLRALTGRKNVVTIAITQSDEETKSDEEGTRKVDVPSRDSVKKTKALLEDAAMLIGVDSDYKQGLGVVGIEKGRDGGEGNVSQVIYLPQFGIVNETKTGEDVASEFNF